MPDLPSNPMLYQINTRVLMRGISGVLGRPAGFDDVPDEALVALKALGVDWVWFLGVWQTGTAGRTISQTNPAWQEGFRQALPDLAPDDVCGSPFAIAGYTAEAAFGGDAALARLRARVNQTGLRLMLDVVPNHMALDHPWVSAQPALFIQGTEADLADVPDNWVKLEHGIFAHGRDPYFPGWPDTVQLDYANRETQTAMAQTLLSVADACDGVRCDMAMLLLPDVFERTWSASLAGRTVAPFWPDATRAVRAAHPGFLFMAEVYWGLEHRLIEDGFDLSYDKALYDALHDGDAGRVRSLLAVDPAAQAHLARFLENHDEARAAAAFDWPRHQAAAVLAFAAPGLRFLHQGQLEGLRVHIPIHLDRGPDEPVDEAVLAFYRHLLPILDEPVFRQGRYEPLPPSPAWDGNPSHQRFVAALWHDANGPAFLLAVNYGPDRGQCRLHAHLADGPVTLTDRMDTERYVRDGAEIASGGLYLDLPPWGFNLFSIGNGPGGG